MPITKAQNNATRKYYNKIKMENSEVYQKMKIKFKEYNDKRKIKLLEDPEKYEEFRIKNCINAKTNYEKNKETILKKRKEQRNILKNLELENLLKKENNEISFK